MKNRIVRSTIWGGFAKALGQVITISTTIIVARLLLKSDIGLMSMVVLCMGILDIFIDMGFLSAIIQARDLTKDQLDSCFVFLVILSLVVFILFLLANGLISDMFSEPRLVHYLPLALIGVLFVPPQIISRGILTRGLQVDKIVKTELAACLLRSTIIISLAASGQGVYSLVIGFLGERVFLGLMLPIVAKWKPRFVFEVGNIKRLVLFGINATLSGFLWYLFSQVDVFIVGRLLGVGVLGVYSMALQFANGLYQFISATANRVVYPVLSRYQVSSSLPAVFKGITGLMATCVFPLCVGFAFVSRDAVILMLGDKWQDVIQPMQLLLVVTAIRSVSSLLPTLFNSIGRPAINVWINLFSLLVFSVAVYWSAINWGLMGVVVSWLVIYPVRYLCIIFLGVRLADLSLVEYLKSMVAPSVATCFMGAVVFFCNYLLSGFVIYLRLVCVVLAGAIVYTAVMLLVFGAYSKYLMKFIKQSSDIDLGVVV